MNRGSGEAQEGGKGAKASFLRPRYLTAKTCVYLGVAEEKDGGGVFQAGLHHHLLQVLPPLHRPVVLRQLHLETLKLRPASQTLTPWHSGAAQPRRHSANSLSRGTLDLESINCNDSIGREGESEAKLTASVLCSSNSDTCTVHPYHCLFVSYPSLLLEKGVCTEHLCTTTELFF